MPAALVPTRPMTDRPPDSLQLPTLGVTVSRRDEANNSHSIKEIFVQRSTNRSKLPRPPSQTAPTPQARGDGIHHFESKDEGESDKDTQKNKRSMVDPPGYSESFVDVALSNQQSREPETAASIHRRRKRLLEERARKIISVSTDVPGKRLSIDKTERTASSSEHESWVPTRTRENDPDDRPIYNYAPGGSMTRQTKEVRDRAFPQRPWRPSSGNRHALNDGELNFSTTNEWVPSEYYRKHHKPPQAMQIFPSGTPHIISPYPPSQTEYQEYQQQLYPQHDHHHQQHNQYQQHQHRHHYDQQQQQEQEQRQREYLQRQLLLQQEMEAEKQHQIQMQKGNTYRPHRLHDQPPSIIHTITTGTTPSDPTAENAPSIVHTITTAATPASTIQENDPAKRKSMDSEMDFSDAVISGTESDTMNGSRIKPRHRVSDDSSIVLDPVSNKFVVRKVSADESKGYSEENSTIQESLISLRRGKKPSSGDSKNREADENSTILDSLKRRQGKNSFEESFSRLNNSFQKLVNKEFTFEHHDDGFDESLLSASLTQLDVPHFIIPTVFVRKSGTSDITIDMDATRLAIESTLTDEEITWQGSTIHNSIISMEEAAITAATTATKEIISHKESKHSSSKNSSSIEADTGGGAGSLIGSGVSANSIKLQSVTESGVSGLTTSGVLGGKDAYGNTFYTVPIAEEPSTQVLKKTEDIASEVSSYVSNALSQSRKDSEGDDRSSWHHRSHITTTSTMVSTKKVANKRNKNFKPRRSSTSTLPSIGFIPEESWDYGDNHYDIDDDEEEEEEEEEEEHSFYEIEEVISDEGSRRKSDFSDDMDPVELERQLSSITEVASRDRSGTNSREMSRKNSRDISLEDNRESTDSRDIESGEESGDDSEPSSKRGKSNSNRSCWEYCVCLDIRCFEEREDGSRGKFNPTMGVYVLALLVLILLGVWTGIGILLVRFLQSK